MRRADGPLGALLALLLFALVGLGSSPAHAWIGFNAPKPSKNRSFNLGIEGSALAPSDGAGWQGSVGLRSSLVEIASNGWHPTSWLGGYVHGQHDPGRDAWRAAVGVGGGYVVGGLEVGAVGHKGPEGWAPGVEVAGLFTVGYAGLHLRHTWLLNREPILEIGLRFNLSAWDKRGHRSRKRERAYKKRQQSARKRLAGLEIESWRLAQALSPPSISPLPCFLQYPLESGSEETRIVEEPMAARIDGVDIPCSVMGPQYAATARSLLTGRFNRRTGIQRIRSINGRLRQQIERFLFDREIKRRKIVVDEEEVERRMQLWHVKLGDRLEAYLERRRASRSLDGWRADLAHEVALEALLYQEGSLKQKLAPWKPNSPRDRKIRAARRRLLKKLKAAATIERGPGLSVVEPLGRLEFELRSEHSGPVKLSFRSRPKRCPTSNQLLGQATSTLVAHQSKTLSVPLRWPPPKGIADRSSARCMGRWDSKWQPDPELWELDIELEQLGFPGPVHRVRKRWSSWLCKTPRLDPRPAHKGGWEVCLGKPPPAASRPQRPPAP